MTNNIALKTYLDEVKNICDELSRGKLSDFIIEMAKSISSKERNKFLQKLKKHSVDESEIPTDNQRMILNRINELREDIIERQKSIDDGSFYEDYYYDEEEADPISEEQKNELEHLFYDAEKLFLANKLDNARDIYEALISLFYMSDKEEEWLDLDLKEVDIKWKETLANYCRCVYETSLPENKIENMIKALKIHLPQFDRDFNLEEEVYPLLQDVYDARNKRIKPHLDDKIITSWNGLVIKALALGSKVFNDKKYLNSAIECFDFIEYKLTTSEGKLLRRYRDGESSINGFLEDYVFLTYGLIELYESTFNNKYLNRAFELTDIVINDFYDSESKGFLNISKSSEVPLVNMKDSYDGAIPSANSILFLVMLKLSVLCEKEKFLSYAEEIMSLFSQRINDNPTSHSQMLKGLLFYRTKISGIHYCDEDGCR